MTVVYRVDTDLKAPVVQRSDLRLRCLPFLLDAGHKRVRHNSVNS